MLDSGELTVTFIGWSDGCLVGAELDPNAYGLLRFA